MAAVSDDIIGHIGAQWGGHRIGLTCRKWVKLLNPKAHMVTTSNLSGRMLREYSRLPNGIFHGDSRLIRRGEVVEVVTYDRGLPQRALRSGAQARIFHGCECTWKNGNLSITHRRGHWCQRNVPEDDIERLLTEWFDERGPSVRKQADSRGDLPVTILWGMRIKLPETYWNALSL